MREKLQLRSQIELNSRVANNVASIESDVFNQSIIERWSTERRGGDRIPRSLVDDNFTSTAGCNGPNDFSRTNGRGASRLAESRRASRKRFTWDCRGMGTVSRLCGREHSHRTSFAVTPSSRANARR